MIIIPINTGKNFLIKMTNIKKAVVYFHQGWTDIIICLPLIKHYSKLYHSIDVIMRDDSKEMVDYFLGNKSENVNIIYINNDNGRFYGQINVDENIDSVIYIPINNNSHGSISIPGNFDILFHAEHDKYRKDIYKGYWYSPTKEPYNHFSEAFYIYYGIEHQVRINDFEIERNLDEELKIYESFVEKYGKDYILYHDDSDNKNITHVPTKIDIIKKEGIKYINLNKITNNPLLWIKVIEKSIEIHLIDSIWACICYQLDAKYSLFKNREMKIYCKRSHENMFQFPIKLPNWELIT